MSNFNRGQNLSMCLRAEDNFCEILGLPNPHEWIQIGCQKKISDPLPPYLKLPEESIYTFRQNFYFRVHQIT